MGEGLDSQVENATRSTIAYRPNDQGGFDTVDRTLTGSDVLKQAAVNAGSNPYAEQDDPILQQQQQQALKKQQQPVAPIPQATEAPPPVQAPAPAPEPVPAPQPLAAPSPAPEPASPFSQAEGATGNLVRPGTTGARNARFKNLRFDPGGFNPNALVQNRNVPAGFQAQFGGGDLFPRRRREEAPRLLGAIR